MNLESGIAVSVDSRSRYVRIFVLLILVRKVLRKAQPARYLDVIKSVDDETGSLDETCG